MATYNGSLYLKEQIDSVLSQTIQDFELIVCDDCSSDDTWSILEEYAKKDLRIRIYRNENNIGFIKNFEKGIYLSKGEYVALCDQDDIWTEDHLEVLLDNIGDKMLSGGDADIMDYEGRPIGLLLSETTGITSFPSNDVERALSFIFNQNLIQGASMLVRRDFLSVALPIPKNVKYHDEWFSLLACFYGGICYTPRVINHYRKHGKNVSIIPRISKNVYNHFKNRIKYDGISYKELMLDEVEKRLNMSNTKKNIHMFL